MSLNHSARSGGISIFFNMAVCRVSSLESPHRGDSNEYTQHTVIDIKKKSPEIIQNTTVSAATMFFFLGSQGRV